MFSFLTELWLCDIVTCIFKPLGHDVSVECMLIFFWLLEVSEISAFWMVKLLLTLMFIITIIIIIKGIYIAQVHKGHKCEVWCSQQNGQ